MTGLAAWYDLRVNIEKAEAGDAVSEPAFKHQSQVGVGAADGDLRYGEEWNK